MRVLALDPGNIETGYVICDFEGDEIYLIEKDKILNDDMLHRMLNCNADAFLIEMTACYGMPVGKTVLETTMWVGRFYESSTAPIKHLIYRKADVCMELCKSMRAKDSNVRQALIDLYGDPGTKAKPGKLYGVSGDVWSALAIAHVGYHKYLKGGVK